jgi:alpha-N-acetylglucosaminidase
MVCLDLFCEERPQWRRTQAFYGKPWLWCNIQNFGNTVFLGGSLRRVNDDVPAARRANKGGDLVGLGFVNEGLGYNPVIHDLMFETAWRDRPAKLSQWVDGYATSRYGKRAAATQRAWSILHATVYTAAHRSRSVIEQIPSLTPAKDAPYDNARLAEAWHQLLQAADTFGDVDTFQFDLVNTARQVLSNHAAVLQRKVVEAQRSGDLAALTEATQEFLGLIRDLDQLLATRREFLLGRTLADARRWGTTDAERARYEWNARRVLTLWGTGPAIRDYACKEWSGMLNGFYAKRWQWYFEELAKAAREERPFNQEAFARDLMEWESAWASTTDQFPAEPHGDSVAVAQRLWAKYGQLRENTR